MDIVEHTLEVDVDDFLSRPLFAHVTTVTDDGAPRHSPMWYIWEDGSVWVVANERRNTFFERIDHEPRVTVGVIDYDQTTGSVEHVGLRGRASLTPFDNREAEGKADEDDRAIRMLCRYLGRREQWPDRFQATPGNEENSWFEVVPEVAVARDQSYEPGPEVLHGTAGRVSHWREILEELAGESGEPAGESSESAAESEEPAGESAESAGESEEQAGESEEQAGESEEPAGESGELAAESEE